MWVWDRMWGVTQTRLQLVDLRLQLLRRVDQLHLRMGEGGGWRGVRGVGCVREGGVVMRRAGRELWVRCGCTLWAMLSSFAP